jgi:hypothetical protein
MIERLCHVFVKVPETSEISTHLDCQCKTHVLAIRHKPKNPTQPIYSRIDLPLFTFSLPCCDFSPKYTKNSIISKLQLLSFRRVEKISIMTSSSVVFNWGFNS